MIADLIKEQELKRLVEVKPLTDEEARANFYVNVGHCGYLIDVVIEREWCYINGERWLKFKTRGNNERDLRAALIKYDIDWWESDLIQCAKDMSSQLYRQAQRKHEHTKLVRISMGAVA